jgi:hypothetical protein
VTKLIRRIFGGNVQDQDRSGKLIPAHQLIIQQPE